MSADVMTPEESDVFAKNVIKELLEACQANDGGPHRWRGSDFSETLEATVLDRLGRVRRGGPMSRHVGLTAECICGVSVVASKLGTR